jgi:hypothetical protein
MTEAEKAAHVAAALAAAKDGPASEALPKLNALINLAKAPGSDELEVEEARSAAFMAICELGKALHRGQPAGDAWAQATATTERWLSRAR